MSHNEELSADQIRGLLFSLRCYLSCKAGHGPCVRNLSWSIRRWNPTCNDKDNLHAGLIVIEAWFEGYRGSPGLGGIRTAKLYTLARLLDYEDTRLKTSSRVRMGLSFAWKASLAIRMIDLLLYN